MSVANRLTLKLTATTTLTIGVTTDAMAELTQGSFINRLDSEASVTIFPVALPLRRSAACRAAAAHRSQDFRTKLYYHMERIRELPIINCAPHRCEMAPDRGADPPSVGPEGMGTRWLTRI
jgi:hypothetical protein